MTIALVAHAFAQGNGSVATTPAINTTGANLLVIFNVVLGGSVLPTDSKGNTWLRTTASNYGAPGGGFITIWYCLTPTVGAGHTFTSNVGASYPSIGVMAFSGAGVLDVQNGNATASGTSLTCGSVTPSQANELVVCGSADAWTGTAAVDSGQTILDQGGLIGGTAFALAQAYEIQMAAIVRNPTWSWSPAARAAATIATFKIAAPPVSKYLVKPILSLPGAMIVPVGAGAHALLALKRNPTMTRRRALLRPDTWLC